MNSYLDQLRNVGLVPSRIEVATWGDWTLVSCFDTKTSEFISESVSMGIDHSPEVATLKALTEYCERRIANESDDPICRLTQRTDGFAAFPVTSGGRSAAQSNSRKNALNEAIERYLWANWWDDFEVEFEVADFPASVKSDVDALVREFDLRVVKAINVNETQSSVGLTVLLAEDRFGGVFTGGAASDLSDIGERLNRCIGELLRHLIVFRRMRMSMKPKSFYEERLFGFGSGQWNQLVQRRLKREGSREIQLPDLIVDREVRHSAMHVVSVHRCLFENQPPFIGGRVDRLCL